MLQDLLDNIRVVLVHTSHPGNIGAVARAMKTMCLKNLYLVQPKLFPDPAATVRAKQAEDILDNAILVDTLQEAIADCCLVMGTSARPRNLVWPSMDIAQAGKQIIKESSQYPVAIVFGRERTGLTNEEIQMCHYQINIPANPHYSSLNLAAAVQIVAYEIYKNVMEPMESAHKDPVNELAVQAELQGLYEHLEQVLIQLAYLDPAQPGQLMPRLQRLYNRARLEKAEVNILRGMLTAVQKKLNL